MSQEAAAAAAVAPGAQTVQADAATAANAKSSNASANEAADTSFSSMGELRRKYPKLYDLMLQGSMTTFFQRQNESNERIKEDNRKSREKNG